MSTRSAAKLSELREELAVMENCYSKLDGINGLTEGLEEALTILGGEIEYTRREVHDLERHMIITHPELFEVIPRLDPPQGN